MFRRVDGDWTEGAFTATDRSAVLLGQVAIPALGGPLLGIALGRWVRAGWIAPAFFLIIVGWVMLANGLADTYRNPMPVLLMRMFAPFTFFTIWTGAGWRPGAAPRSPSSAGSFAYARSRSRWRCYVTPIEVGAVGCSYAYSLSGSSRW